MESQAAIELSKVVVQFGSFTVHRGISFAIPTGQVVTLLGPSGTGKTVVLKLICGLLTPSSGDVIVMGNTVSNLPEAELVAVRADIGMLFQGAALFDSLTVFDNVAYSLRERGQMDEDDIAQTVREKLAVVGLSDIEHKYPPALSGGQKKRVGLARALASSPKVVLFDEPTTGLDPTATRHIGDLIVKLRDKFGITSVVVTHDIETAKRISDRWILLHDGAVVADGPVEDLVRTNADVLEFISGKWIDD